MEDNTTNTPFVEVKQLEPADTQAKGTQRFWTSRKLGLLAGVISGLTWGLDTALLNKAYLLSPYDGNWTTLSTGAVTTMIHDMLSATQIIVLCVCLGLFKEMKHAASSRGFFWMLLASIFGAPLGMLGYLLAIDNLGGGYAAAISSLYPALGGLLAFLILRDRLFRLGWVGLALAVLGTIGTSLTAVFAGGDDVKNAGTGIVFALMCVVGWGVECVIADYSFRSYTMHSSVALLIRQTTSAVIYNAIVLPANGGESYDLIRAIFHSDSIGWIVGASVSGTVSYLCYYYAIDKLGATQAIGLNITYAVWAIIFSLCFDIYPDYAWLIVICIVLIALGSFLCSGLGKEPRPWILLKSWVGKATPEELKEMTIAQSAEADKLAVEAKEREEKRTGLVLVATTSMSTTSADLSPGAQASPMSPQPDVEMGSVSTGSTSAEES